MELWWYVKRGEWPVVLGYVFFVSTMAAGYFYNLTFVQLGLVDLGARVIGLGEGGVATYMATFAVVTASVALLTGWLMQRHGWGERFVAKLRLALVSVVVQTLLTGVVPLVHSERLFFAWILTGSISLGIGIPATFGLAVDLVPVRARGSAGALITAGAFFPAAVFTSDWQIEPFARQMLPITALGAVVLGGLAFGRFPLIERLAMQHTRPAFAHGRLVQADVGGRLGIDRRLFAVLVLMFGIYFIDSLGFLRIVVTPVLVALTWQSPELATLLFIGAVHVLGAAIAGVLYGALGLRPILLWIFGIFALLHLSYALHVRIVPESFVSLNTAMLYALAVSMYTVLNFAIWADLSTPRTITLNSALGVALSGWTATFLSTAISLRWGAEELPLVEHFDILAALAMTLFLIVLTASIVQVWRRSTVP